MPDSAELMIICTDIQTRYNLHRETPTCSHLNRSCHEIFYVRSSWNLSKERTDFKLTYSKWESLLPPIKCFSYKKNHLTIGKKHNFKNITSSCDASNIFSNTTIFTSLSLTCSVLAGRDAILLYCRIGHNIHLPTLPTRAKK